MQAFSLHDEQAFSSQRHVEKILGRVADGDVTVACWEAGQISPYHSHPEATEIYFCFEGGGVMRTPEASVPVTPGSLVSTRPASFTNTRTARNARSFFASDTGQICGRSHVAGASRGSRRGPS